MSGSDCSDGFTQALQKLQARLCSVLLTDCNCNFTHTTRAERLPLVPLPAGSKEASHTLMIMQLRRMWVCSEYKHEDGNIYTCALVMLQVANDQHMLQAAAANKAAPEKPSHIPYQRSDNVLIGHSRSAAEEPPGPALGVKHSTTATAAHKG